jgi:myo-inositol 2-dehydrogenase/D-chiro-inositol 1-dehydrogenase
VNAGYEVGLEVLGDAGVVRIAPADVPVLRKQRYAGHPIEGDWLERFPAAYVLEMQRWTENLRDGRLTGPDAWDGYASLLAVESCIASVHSGSKKPFKSPQVPELYR